MRGNTRLSFALHLAPHLALLCVLLLAWNWAVASGLIATLMVARPSAIAGAIVKLYVTKGMICQHFFITLTKAVVGCVCGAGVATALAVPSSLSETFGRYVSPYAVVLNATAGIAVTPIIIAWFGYGMGSKIALRCAVLLSDLRQHRDRPAPDRPRPRGRVRSLGATPRQVFLQLHVPAALPLMFAGLKIGPTTALIGAVVAEFAQVTAGVVVVIIRVSFSLDMASSLATLIGMTLPSMTLPSMTLPSMTLTGLMLFCTMDFLDDRIVFWRRDARMAAVSRARAQGWTENAQK